MKKENTKKPLANLKKSYRKLSVVQKMILFIGLMFIVISTLPAVMVLLIGLLPTFYDFDYRPQKHRQTGNCRQF